MKNFLQISVVLLSIFSVVSCQKETTKEAPERSLIIIVKDYSASISQSKTEQEMEIQHLTHYLNQHLIENTDVMVMNINSHSDSRTNTTWFKFNAPKVQQATRVQSESEKELEQTFYLAKVRKTLKSTQKKIIEQMYGTTTSSNQTAIVELLYPISEVLKNYNKVNVCIYSDLIQESDFTDFTKGEWPMSSKTYASNLAKTDFERLQKQGLEIDLIKVISIDVVTPNEPENEKYYVTMPYYWDTLLKLGHYNGKINWQKL
ncbi:MAG: hypothetical protein O9282_02815 [Flavobacterium sp.]|uniref:hypothetical protein n=1 Tax=Flavobacterium sp. TaxID=239 RepID=UPI0022BB3D69|nr:hypothetical protein [Flavobacterium sp.]MCZ8330224.1 hypothetical protein [Flavobacterium sp.]